MSTPNEARTPRAGFGLFSSTRGGEDGGRLVDVRELEHHEERHEPDGQGKQDDLPPVLAQDGEIFPEVDFVFLVSQVGFSSVTVSPLRIFVSSFPMVVYRYCQAAESPMDLMLPSLPGTPPPSVYRS